MKLRYVYWQANEVWLGYLDEYPDYWTQGHTEDELLENLIALYQDLTSGAIEAVRRVAEIEVA
ncbi:MAG: hypothetical protein JSV66_16255 [Trueperaceae bacterium]|nr:MAG: hypothetical protein JSV66_16255 [Trueperaceae bacterium]